MALVGKLGDNINWWNAQLSAMIMAVRFANKMRLMILDDSVLILSILLLFFSFFL